MCQDESTATMTAVMNAWYEITNAAEVASPALLVYPDRIEENLRRMVAAVGAAERLAR